MCIELRYNFKISNLKRTFLKDFFKKCNKIRQNQIVGIKQRIRDDWFISLGVFRFLKYHLLAK